MSADRSTVKLRLALDEKTRAAHELGSAIWTEVTPNREPLCGAKNLWAALTPELSRTALRPWQNTILPWTAEAAKRSRLERIVSAESFRDCLHVRLLGD